MKSIKKCGLKRSIVIVLIILGVLYGLTACSKNTDNSMLLQGTWEIDTGSGAGYKFDGDKFWWVKSVEDFNDNYWYGDADIDNGDQAMKAAGLTYGEIKSNLPGIEPENIFCTDLYPEKIFSDGEDKTSTNMSDDTLWTKLWMIYESDKKIKAVVIDLQTFKMEDYTKVE